MSDTLSESDAQILTDRLNADHERELDEQLTQFKEARQKETPFLKAADELDYCVALVRDAVRKFQATLDTANQQFPCVKQSYNPSHYYCDKDDQETGLKFEGLNPVQFRTESRVLEAKADIYLYTIPTEVPAHPGAEIAEVKWTPAEQVMEKAHYLMQRAHTALRSQ
eukprot:COSAG02_NODE_5560_length_4229_cov_3.560291_4_plen_167_part_00